MAPRPLNDRDWLAYRYLTGELDHVAWAEVEARLAEDLPLQESLARMAPLCGALAACAEDRPRAVVVQGAPRREDVLRRGWAAVLSAAVLLLGMGWLSALSVRETTVTEIGPRAHSSEDAESLLSLWADLRLQRRHGADAVREEPELADELEVPRWMLAALQIDPLEEEEVQTAPMDADPSETL